MSKICERLILRKTLFSDQNFRQPPLSPLLKLIWAWASYLSLEIPVWVRVLLSQFREVLDGIWPPSISTHPNLSWAIILSSQFSQDPLSLMFTLRNFPSTDHTPTTLFLVFKSPLVLVGVGVIFLSSTGPLEDIVPVVHILITRTRFKKVCNITFNKSYK